MYEKLYEAWKRERESEELQPLSKDFYSRLADYIRRLMEESRMLDEKTLRGRLLLKERENVKWLAEDLVKARFNKIMEKISAGGAVSEGLLTIEESAFYSRVSPQTESYMDMLNRILQGKPPRLEEEEKSKMMLVRILKEIPAIVGADMKTYGPFKPEDVAALPRENAKVLIRQGMAEEIETS